MDISKLKAEGWDGFGWRNLQLGEGIILAEGVHNWCTRCAPFFSFTLAFVLQLRKGTEYFSPGGVLTLFVEYTVCGLGKQVVYDHS
jgi:hypothetical protein